MSIYPDAGKRLTSNYMAELSYDARSFFNVYYNLLLDRSMTSYLKAQAAEQAQSIGAAGAGQALQAFTEIDLEKSSRFDLKNWFVANSVNPSAGSANAQQIVKSFSEQNSFYDEAYNIAHSSKGVVTKTLSNSEHANYWNLDPQHSGQFKRYTVAKTQLKKFGAVARAVRSSIAAQLVDKPMELLLLFILVAGVDSGPNKPLWDEMFSQDSAFYMSKNVFISYLTGVVISIFADVWVKVQTDVRVEKLGGFDSIPSGKDAKRSFNSWYWHEFRHNEKNKWWDHHKEYSSLIYHNMKPALVLMAITGFINLGRLDADFWVMGYAFAFLLPFSGLSLKLEQTYEIASGWVMRNVPENLRKHPLILEWANKESTKLRIQFQLYYKLYENILGQWLNNIMAVTTAVSGTRGFTRAVFGGKTVTEHIIEKTTELRSLSFPGAKYVDKACRILFSGNYNSGKLPDEPND